MAARASVAAGLVAAGLILWAAAAAADPLAIDYVNHRSNIQAFLRALDGEAPLELDGAEARKAVSIVIAAYESARTGKPVRP